MSTEHISVPGGLVHTESFFDSIRVTSTFDSDSIWISEGLCGWIYCAVSGNTEQNGTFKGKVKFEV